MSLMLFGQSEPEPVPEEPATSTRRRYLIILATVIALILGGGSAAFLLLSSGPSANRISPNPYTPPIDGNPTPDGPSDPTATHPTGSPTASPSHSPSPSRSPSVSPKPSGVTPVTYRVPNDDLCALVDLADINALSTPPSTPSVASQRKDVVDSGSILYTCTGNSGKVTIRVEATIYPSTDAALASYQESKMSAPAGNEAVSGVGSQAFGYIWNTTGYFVMATAGNLKFKMLLTAAGGVPTPGKLRDVAILSSRNTVPKLR
jgi:hypothetical protein